MTNRYTSSYTWGNKCHDRIHQTVSILKYHSSYHKILVLLSIYWIEWGRRYISWVRIRTYSVLGLDYDVGNLQPLYCILDEFVAKRKLMTFLLAISTVIKLCVAICLKVNNPICMKMCYSIVQNLAFSFVQSIISYCTIHLDISLEFLF